jgi:predicted permease
MTESVIVALLGGSAGIGFAYLGILFLSRYHPADVATLPGMRLDSRVLLFGLTAALGSSLLFGLGPALHTTRTNMVSALKSGPPTARARRRMIGRNVLVVGQITATLLLLVVGGMMLEGFRRRMDADPGFRVDHVIAVQADPGVLGYSAAQTRRFYRDLAERARVVPGVEAVALSENVPSRPTDYWLVPEGHRAPATQAAYGVLRIVCDDRYFATLQMPVLQGRGFDAGDRDGSPRVGLVNEQFVERFWPGQAAVGRHLRLEREDGPEVEVVGVVRAPIRDDYPAPPGATVFLPYEQNQRTRMTLLVAHAGNAARLAAPLRAVVHGLDTGHPVPEMRTLESYDREAERAMATIVGWFIALGLIGLGLAVIGLYALIAYSVSRRTAEIGLRLALGSTRAGVLGLVVGQGLAVAATGVALAALVVGLTHAALAG